MKAIFPGSDTRPTQVGDLDLSHDPIWVIWLAEVRKFHQHHDRINHTDHFRRPYLDNTTLFKGIDNQRNMDCCRVGFVRDQGPIQYKDVILPV